MSHQRFTRVPVMIGVAVALGAVGAAIASVDVFLGGVAAVVVATAAALMFAAQLNRPSLGIAILLVMALIAPVEIRVGESTLSLSLAAAAAACAAWVVHVVVLRTPRALLLPGSRVAAATLALMAAAVVSFVVGQYPWFPLPGAPMRAQVGGLVVFLLSGTLLLTIGHQVTSMAQLRRLTFLFVGVGAIALLSSVVPFMDVHIGPIALTNPSSMGSMYWTWFVAVTFSQALANRELSPWLRAGLCALGCLALARGLLVGLSWVSGWLPPLVALGVVLLTRFPRVTIGGGLLCGIAVVPFAGRAIEGLSAAESYSLVTRWEALQTLATLLAHNPLFGFGPANYHYYTELVPILGWYVRFNSHNHYVDLLLQIGVVGLLAFTWLVVEVSLMLARLRQRARAGFPSAYLLGAAAGLAGSLVAGVLADWIIPFAYNIGMQGFRSSVLFWFFLGGVLAMSRLVGADARAAAEAAARSEPLALARA